MRRGSGGEKGMRSDEGICRYGNELKGGKDGWV